MPHAEPAQKPFISSRHTPALPCRFPWRGAAGPWLSWLAGAAALTPPAPFTDANTLKPASTPQPREHLQAEPPSLMFGRLPDCDVVLEDGLVSKQHAELRWNAAERRCTVKDLGSRNGTFLNGTLVMKREAVEL